MNETTRLAFETVDASRPQYRFDNGHLYELRGDAYFHCFADYRITNELDAISAYESKLDSFCDMFE